MKSSSLNGRDMVVGDSICMFMVIRMLEMMRLMMRKGRKMRKLILKVMVSLLMVKVGMMMRKLCLFRFLVCFFFRLCWVVFRKKVCFSGWLCCSRNLCSGFLVLLVVVSIWLVEVLVVMLGVLVRWFCIFMFMGYMM